MKERQYSMMKKMAQLWMRSEEEKLEADLRRFDELDRPDLPIAVVVDTSCLVRRLDLVRTLLKLELFWVVVPWIGERESDRFLPDTKYRQACLDVHVGNETIERGCFFFKSVFF